MGLASRQEHLSEDLPDIVEIGSNNAHTENLAAIGL
jgi:hypothetical protein